MKKINTLEKLIKTLKELGFKKKYTVSTETGWVTDAEETRDNITSDTLFLNSEKQVGKFIKKHYMWKGLEYGDVVYVRHIPFQTDVITEWHLEQIVFSDNLEEQLGDIISCGDGAYTLLEILKDSGAL